MQKSTDKKVAVILAGCGHLDGSEIHESVLTLLAICREGASYDIFAPDKNQYHVLNHLSGEEMTESRNVLVEAARIARGNIKPVTACKVENYDAIFFPGGFGAAKNWFDFALKGDASYEVEDEILALARAFKEAHKPAGYICISPMMVPLIYDDEVKITIGTDLSVAQIVESRGAIHEPKAVDEISIDEKHKVVTTPAYMLGQNICEVATGIEKLVKVVLGMV
ncbi:MAG: isoprenoid biosynthesis glyoxalase ElbB [Francisellaceae bacterium]